MKIAITTPTGHVGSAVVDYLMETRSDVTVRLLGRRPEKLRKYVERGAETAIGSQDDAEYLVNATRDVDALLWVTPPGYGATDLREYQVRFAQAAATAIRTNNIPRVVNISSIGANLESGAGPISGLHHVEAILDEASLNITHFRPGFFFENLFWQLDSIRKWGRVSLPIDGTIAYPMIDSRDIGQEAAERLLNQNWIGHFVRELHGPRDMTFKQVAATMQEVLGRKIVYITCSPQEMHDFLIESGISENGAEQLLQMYEAVNRGKVYPMQPRTDETTTSTTFSEFVREVMLPTIAQPVSPV